MRVLIGCESSGNTRRAFAARGIFKWTSAMCCTSCVVTSTSSSCNPLAPTCASGLHWNKRGRIEADGRPRAEHTEEAIAFAVEMMQADIPRIAMENPVGCLSTRYRKPDQYIQPYEFGHDASKTTCLWLKDLPPLTKDPALWVPPRLVCDDCGCNFVYGMHKCPECKGEQYKPRWANQTDSGQNALTPSDDRWKVRSETYSGWSEAMAEQWGNLA